MAEIVVVGAGVAGLAAAYHAGQTGHEVKVYEAKDRWGGLLDHFMVDGFRFDSGVHFAFSSNEEFRALIEKTEYKIHKPEPYNYEQGQWLKHPVQNNLYPLPVDDKVKAIKSFVERPEQTAVHENYRQWLDQQFGKVIAARYPARYTEKYWTVKAEKLGTEWVGNRLYRPSLDEVLFGALSDQTPQTYYLQEMLYPRRGGFRAFLDPLVPTLDLQLNSQVVKVDHHKRYLELSNGKREYYNLLVSSAPLPELILMMDSVPATVREAAASLWATSTALISLGFDRPDAGKHLWFYIYDHDIYPSRVHAPYRKAAENAPPGCSSLQFEIYYSRYRPLPASPEGLIEHVIDAAENMKLAPRNAVKVADYRILPYSFVVFDLGMTAKRDHVLDYIRQCGIFPVGRFGLWDYLWSDQSYLSGCRINGQLDML
jgi:protoporphyrinogen oxidase